MAGFTSRIGSSLAERFASTWVLLSDTTKFLSRTSVFSQYEGQLRDMRKRLASAKDSPQALRSLRQELIDLRSALRIQGYDLSLGALDVSIKDFRNDSALSEGFKRIVIFIGDGQLWFIAGEDNHRVLHDLLDSECSVRGISGIAHKHYLWYRWNRGLLLLSGADSETPEDFGKLKAWGEIPENRLLLLARLRGSH